MSKEAELKNETILYVNSDSLIEELKKGPKTLEINTEYLPFLKINNINPDLQLTSSQAEMGIVNEASVLKYNNIKNDNSDIDIRDEDLYEDEERKTPNSEDLYEDESEEHVDVNTEDKRLGPDIEEMENKSFEDSEENGESFEDSDENGEPSENINESESSENINESEPYQNINQTSAKGMDTAEKMRVDEGDMNTEENMDVLPPERINNNIETDDNQQIDVNNKIGGRRTKRRMVSFADMFTNQFTRKRRYRKKTRRVRKNKSRKSCNRRRKTRRH